MQHLHILEVAKAIFTKTAGIFFTESVYGAIKRELARNVRFHIICTQLENNDFMSVTRSLLCVLQFLV